MTIFPIACVEGHRYNPSLTTSSDVKTKPCSKNVNWFSTILRTAVYIEVPMKLFTIETSFTDLRRGNFFNVNYKHIMNKLFSEYLLFYSVLTLVRVIMRE